jgi:hypothetical protein
MNRNTNNESEIASEVNRSAALHQRLAPAVDQAAKTLGRKRRASVKDEAVADPVAELRRLVGIHKNLATDIQRLGSMIKDREFTRDDGTTVLVKCTKSAATIADTQNCIRTYRAEQTSLVGAMRDELRKLPIYQVFLSKVYGVGSVLAAYLVAMVRIEKCANFSQLNRYCGNAPDFRTGWRETRSAAPKEIGGEGTFNDALRRNNYLIMTTMRKCASKKTQTAPHGTTTKYLDRWLAASHFERTNPREPRAGTDGKPRRPIPDYKGRMKATDLFLWDLYVVWRALEGLDMRHDKFSVQRGRDHAGREVNLDVRFTLSVEEAIEWVGDVGGHPAAGPVVWKADVDGEHRKASDAAPGCEPEEVAAE